MKLNKVKEVLPDPSMYHSFSRAGYEWYAALCDILDNSVDAIRQKMLELPEKERAKFVGQVHILAERTDSESSKDSIDKLYIVDNGCGVEPNKVPDVFSSGRSQKAGLHNSLGVFGMGLKTAGMSVAEEITFSSRDHYAEDYETALFSPEQQVKSGHFDVPHGKTPKRIVNLIESKIGKNSTGTCVTLDRLHGNIPRARGWIHNSLENTVARVYRYILTENKLGFHVPIKFYIGSGGKVVDSTTAVDPLLDSSRPELTDWYFGGPNGEFTEREYNGQKILLRCSHTKLQKKDRGKGHKDNSGLGAGVRGSYKQGTYFIRGGREIVITRDTFWAGLTNVSNFFLEVVFEDSGINKDSLIQTDFGKKGVIVDEGLRKFMKDELRYAVDSIRKYKPAEVSASQKQVETSIASTLGKIFKTPRSAQPRSPSQVKKTVQDKLSVDKARNKGVVNIARPYAGSRLGDFEHISNSGHRSRWEFKVVNQMIAKDLPFWEELSEKRNEFVVVLNKANSWIRDLFDKKLYTVAYPVAAGVILNLRDKSEEEKVDYLSEFGSYLASFTEVYDPPEAHLVEMEKSDDQNMLAENA